MDESSKLGSILVRLGVLHEADVDRILDALDRRFDHAKFGQVAREMGLLCEEHVLAALAVQMDLFPGIEHYSLDEILDCLLTACDTEATPL